MNPSNPELNQLIQEFQEEYGTCLDWIFQELNQPENLGYDKSFITATRVSSGGGGPYGGTYRNPLINTLFSTRNTYFSQDVQKMKVYKDRIRINRLALENLSYTSFFGFLIGFQLLSKGLINSSNFTNIYFWLEQLYYICVERELSYYDVLNIYFSGLTERIVCGLDEFDEFDDTPEPDRDFFQRLNIVKNNDQNVKKFFIKSKRIIKTALEQKYSTRALGNLDLMEENLLNLLAACSAAGNAKENITINDYIKAYKTYYKLIRSDITQYKCQPELFYDKYIGYLVCEKCGSYYQLKRGESPSEFGECRCGGSLKYVKYLSDDDIIKWKYVVINTLFITLICIGSYYVSNLLYYILLVFFIVLVPSSFTMIRGEYEKRGLVLGGSLAIFIGFILSSTILFLFPIFKAPENLLFFVSVAMFMILILVSDLFLILKKRIKN